MPYEITVLRYGHCIANEGANGAPMLSTADSYDVACTITLLRGDHTILVDTGSACESSYLKDALSKNQLTCEDIEYVIGTHGHSDHIGNLNLFPNATHIVCHDINRGTTYYQHPFSENVPYAIDKDLTVESTPGHTSQDITVYVQSNDHGLVAVCGDIFENEHDLSDPSQWQAQSQFPEMQEKSRTEILKRADTIIPGHGALFKVKDIYKKDPHEIMITSVELGVEEETPIS